MSSDTHSAKRERAKAEGALERRVSVSSPSGLECRAALWRERAKTEEKSFGGSCPSGLNCRVAPPEHKVACFPDPAQSCLFLLQGTRLLDVKSTRLLVSPTRHKVA